MSQHPLFAKPAVVSAVVTVNVTQEHIDRADAEGLHPVSLAILDAMPGTDDADVIRDGAYTWTGDEVTFLRFGPDGIAFLSTLAMSPGSPVTFTAEVIKP